VARYEREAIAAGQESIKEHLREKFRFAVARDPTAIHPEDAEGFLRGAHLDLELLDRLTAMPKDELLNGERAASILFGMETATSIHLDELNLPGVPDETALEEIIWTAGLLCAALAAVASAAGHKPEEGVGIAVRHVHGQTIQLTDLAEKAKADRRRLRRERILPDTETLDKIQRYEAHLDRVLIRTLHELHRIQAARGRRAVPMPAALDVDLTIGPSLEP
jgi:hypothetical protein